MLTNKTNLKLFFLCLSFLTLQLTNAQDFSDQWTGYFSYLNIKDVSQGADRVFGASENAVFVYNKNSNDIETISTIHGLSGEEISVIKYAEDRGLLFLGFENGLIQIYDESDNTVLSVVDILEKPTIPQSDKKINHFNLVDDTLYIATDYGISVYDLEGLEFGDTYYIGAGGSQIVISQTTIFDGDIYAATATGIKKGAVINPNLIDYQEWEQVNGGNWVGIEAVGTQLFAANASRKVYELVSGALQIKATYPNFITDFRVFDSKLIVTTQKEVYIYNPVGFSGIAQVGNSAEFSTNYTCALMDDTDQIYIGTEGTLVIGKTGFGVLKTSIADTSILEEIHPDGPLLNNFFKIEVAPGHIYGTHGGYDVSFNPYAVATSRAGISHFFDESWQNVSYDTILATANNPRSLSHISVDPLNPEIAYISSSIGGLLKLENNIPVTFYNGDNSTINPFFTNNHFVHASVFDAAGSLWVMNSRYDSPLNKFRDGQWSSFSFLEVIEPADSNKGFAAITTDANNTIFTGSYNYGIVGYDESSGAFNTVSEEDAMPSNAITALTIDRSGQLWVGTDKGLRVIYNTTDFITGTPEVDDIIVLDDGVPRELLFQQYITDIEVDGSNNKWIGTLDTGLYYFSSDGQSTIFHFTKDNSPLPTNDVLDVSIDDVNGMIYIATDKGLVSFKSDASKPQSTLENAYVYPNPVRPNFNILTDKVKIRDISENVNIKITDIEGNLVAEAQSRTNGRFQGYNLEIDGGTALWNGKNLGGNIVASGVYLIMLNDLDTFETKVLKLMVVR
ncbi:type IX secretion system anionic LPS delivery protein PorZ [Olleya namhaensis]|uniref:Two component regulator propeller n=1 Tax=Olleya namhaensis TaxID=1144750 RepID=A0A1I3J477_9FLAO|nr:two-component regulator propeller domain-containing protein [Olleya namhaensis]SFI55091.1 Two component regulator propeller [Olleya namhaensis]